MDVMARADNTPAYKVRVSFGCHTFTRELTFHDQPDLHFRDGKELRCFCTDRYRLSLQLPDMIRYAANGRVYFSARATFLVIECESAAKAPYVAFFNAEKAKNRNCPGGVAAPSRPCRQIFLDSGIAFRFKDS
jgi:hypothetical protein